MESLEFAARPVRPDSSAGKLSKRNQLAQVHANRLLHYQQSKLKQTTRLMSDKTLYLKLTTTKQDITETMSKVCEILTSDPPGSNARIRFELFKEIYVFLISQVEKSTPLKYVDEVCSYLDSEWV